MNFFNRVCNTSSHKIMHQLSLLFHLQMEAPCEHLPKKPQPSSTLPPPNVILVKLPHTHTFLQVTLHLDAKEITLQNSPDFPIYMHTSERQKLHTYVKVTMLTASGKEHKKPATKKALQIKQDITIS